MHPGQQIEELQELLKEAPKIIDAARLSDLLVQAVSFIRQTCQGISMRGIDGVPDWHKYEMELWEISEQLRPVLRARRDFRGKTPVNEAIKVICSNHEMGKGRQNFVLLLGEFGKGSYSDTLIALIEDPDVGGQAIKALLKAKCFTAAEPVRRVAETTKFGWIRSAAKKYLAQAKV